MIIGFLGTGAISEAIIRGLCEESGYQGPILVTQRSVERSSRLAHDYPQVEVIDNNNALVERSEWVFLGVLPEQVTDVLNALTFRPEQKLISLAAGISLAQIQALAPPCDQVIRAIPMPPIEFGLGPVALCPTDTPLEAFFSRIGTAVSVSDEQQFNLFGATSALMADYFDQIATVTTWMASHGMDSSTAARYTTALYHALSVLTTKQSPDALQMMSEQCQTPGGLNEQFLIERAERGANDSLRDGLDQILTRLESVARNSR